MSVHGSSLKKGVATSTMEEGHRRGQNKIDGNMLLTDESDSREATRASSHDQDKNKKEDYPEPMDTEETSAAKQSGKPFIITNNIQNQRKYNRDRQSKPRPLYK